MRADALRRVAWVALLVGGLGLEGARAQNSFGGPAPMAPATGATPAPPSPPGGSAPGAGQRSELPDPVERQDFGVAPSTELHAGAMHGPTPASIPGGRIITTNELVELRRGGAVRALVFDVLGGPEALPGAVAAVPAHQPGSFNDAVQREFGRFLEQMTQGRKDTPLVFYCQSVECWMSYNASLRAIRMGYTQVLWYRGGIEAWKRAGQSVQSAAR